jgi:hypothetical protein
MRALDFPLTREQAGNERDIVELVDGELNMEIGVLLAKVER